MIEFGKSIKQNRLERNITQRNLAAKVGITVPYLSMIENGKKEPSNQLIRDICHQLDLPVEILFWSSLQAPEGVSDDDRKILEMAKIIISKYTKSDRVDDA